MKCEYCEENKPHLHYYLTKHVIKYKDFDDCLLRTRKDMVEYYHSYGKNGFMSEYTPPSYLDEHNIRYHAKREYDADITAELDMNKVACHHFIELQYLTEDPLFVKFYEK
jgi:hypothetical protein